MSAKRIIEGAIVALIVINLSELGFFFKIRKEAAVYSSEVRFPVPSGYLSDGAFMKANDRPCSLIRLSSDNCPYCRLDQSLYSRLDRQSRQVGCTSIILAPKMGEIKRNGNNDGRTQLQFINMAFGRALNPVMTPETILLDSRGYIKWDWEGALDDQALADGLHALRSF